MARIRTIKPDFFRHEGLQDLEAANPGHHVMLVFAALWGHCDKLGHFQWRPRTLKLDILPFVEFDMAKTLDLLEAAGFISRYAVGGKEYGNVPTFDKHQRVSGKEASDPAKHPVPPKEANRTMWGSNGEAMGKHPVILGTGREGEQEQEQEGKGTEVGSPSARADALPTEPRDDHLPFGMDRRLEGDAIDLWNEVALRIGLPEVQRLTKPREIALRQRLEECDGLEGWRAALAKIEASSFLSGKLRRGDSHKNWRCTFDFVIKESIFTRLMEGAFDDCNDNRETFENGFAAFLAEAK